MFNGRRVDVRHEKILSYAVNDEASKKLISIFFYRNHNYKIKVMLCPSPYMGYTEHTQVKVYILVF